MALRLGKRRTVDLPDEQRVALRALVAAPKFELIPLKNALDWIGVAHAADWGDAKRGRSMPSASAISSHNLVARTVSGRPQRFQTP